MRRLSLCPHSWTAVVYRAGTHLYLSPTEEGVDPIEKERSPAGGDGRGGDPGLPLRLPVRQTRGIQRSSKTTAQAQTAEQTGQTQGGELGQARSELGPKVAKIMNRPNYHYGEWGYLEVDPSDGQHRALAGPRRPPVHPRLFDQALQCLRDPRRPRLRPPFQDPGLRAGERQRTARSAATWCSWPAAT